jgi:soluble lytic murein transglycosylase-like protein
MNSAARTLSNWALLLLAVCFVQPAVAISPAALEQEPPIIRRLLNESTVLAKNTGNPQGMWQAAAGYCEAARFGSTEAQYQLGMLYAFGQGVPQRQDFAAALFALASQQGHYEAQQMLETVHLVSHELPGCVSSAEQLPERPVLLPTIDAAGQDLERQLGRLPANKRWVVELVQTLSRWYAIDARLALAIISVESNFDPRARSPKNAMGLMQLIPQTAERFNVRDAFNASQNVKGGLTYLRWLLARYKGNVALAAAGYNAGEKAVDRYRGIPPYPETRQYVKRVLQLYRQTEHPFDQELAQRLQ